ncbi:UNVERIFIED_ORG: hypothetical protein QOE_1555 [Clostridioides difficile F501]
MIPWASSYRAEVVFSSEVSESIRVLRSMRKRLIWGNRKIIL